jgi:hypothetical protein
MISLANPRLAVILVASMSLVSVSFAQRGGFGRRAVMPPIQIVPYDGRFTFARLTFTTGPGGYYYGGLPAWAHGYPDAEHNLMKLVREISILRPHVEQTTVVALDDPNLFRYPVAYMAEPDFWTMNDKEAAALRAYILKGGFIIFDDFRDNFRDGFAGWANFAEQMKRVMPEGKFVDMDPRDPIFHSFFDIPSFDIVRQYYDRGKPVFRGMYEKNDPHKRLLMIINFNTDVSNYWEFSATGFRPVDESNQAYKLGVNYIMYALTH